ncbi:MAG: hypothetical protein ACRBFS_24435 [Aureispira sp.]
MGLTAAAVMATNGKKKSQTPDLSIDPVTTVPDTYTVFSDSNTRGLSTMSGIGNITIKSQPDYDNWQRKEWALWYRAIAQQEGPARAIDTLWAAWNVEANSIAFKLPSSYHLERVLVLWQPKATVGNFNITENSTPVYDTWAAWWNNIPVWNCPEWMAWFDAMEIAWDLQTAQYKFSSGWTNPDNWNITGVGRKCREDCSFIKIMIERGIDVAPIGMHTLCSIINVPYNLIKATENVSEGIKDTTSLASKVMPVAILGGGAYYLYKKYT